jgi:hypothetical protein
VRRDVSVAMMVQRGGVWGMPSNADTNVFSSSSRVGARPQGPFKFQAIDLSASKSSDAKTLWQQVADLAR